MWKFLKVLLGLMLLPACWSVSVATYNLHQISAESEAAGGFEAWALPSGVFLWVVLFFLFPRPTRTYVLGHELTHAVWSLMMGGRIGKIKVGKSDGYVELTKTNFIVALAPYFFPFYTVLLIAAYYLAGIWLEVEPHKAWWLGAAGVTWAFHITFTIHMLADKQQPDIKEHGRFFSYSVIYLMNVLVIGLWMVMIGSPELRTFKEMLARETVTAYNYAYRQLLSAWIFADQWIGRIKG